MGISDKDKNQPPGDSLLHTKPEMVSVKTIRVSYYPDASVTIARKPLYAEAIS